MTTRYTRTAGTKSGRTFTSGLAPSGHALVHFNDGQTWLRRPEGLWKGERPTMFDGDHIAPTFAVSS